MTQKVRINESQLKKIVKESVKRILKENQSNGFSEDAKKMVCGQIINMLDCDILDGQGTEPFMGWLEDGDVFFEENEQLAQEATELAKQIAPIVDNLSNVLGTYGNDRRYAIGSEGMNEVRKKKAPKTGTIEWGDERAEATEDGVDKYGNPMFRVKNPPSKVNKRKCKDGSYRIQAFDFIPYRD